jgi:hypothetical protein
VERFAIDETELRSPISRRLEQPPQSLEGLFDLMPGSGGQRHAGADRLDQIADEDQHLADPHPTASSLFLVFELVDDPRKQEDGQ